MPAPKYSWVDQITRPARSPGVNWGKPIIVLARFGEKEMWKTKGVMASLNDYSPGQLILVSHADLHWRNYRPGDGKVVILQEGGRVSNKTFSDHSQAINEFFGCSASLWLYLKKTLIIEEGTP